MELLGLITGYIALFLLVIICFKPLIRKLSSKNSFFYKVNMFLVKYHFVMGILLIVLILMHCKLSSKGSSTSCAVISCVCIVISISCFFIKRLFKNWLFLHLVFSILSLLFAVLHMVEVKTDKSIYNSNSYEVLINNEKI